MPQTLDKFTISRFHNCAYAPVLPEVPAFPNFLLHRINKTKHTKEFSDFKNIAYYCLFNTLREKPKCTVIIYVDQGMLIHLLKAFLFL